MTKIIDAVPAALSGGCMRQEFLARLRGKQALLGQLLAVFMLLQPVAAAIGADLAL